MKAIEAREIAVKRETTSLERIYSLIEYSAGQKRFYCWVVDVHILDKDLKQLENDGYKISIDDKGDYKIEW